MDFSLLIYLLFATMVSVLGFIPDKVSKVSDFTDKSSKFTETKNILSRKLIDTYHKASSRHRRSPVINLDRHPAAVSDTVEIEDAASGTFNATILKIDMPGAPTQKTTDIPVDNTIRELRIKITAKTGQPGGDLSDDGGRFVPPFTAGDVTLTDTGHVRLWTIKNPKPGTWQLTKKVSPIPWHIEVTGLSTVDITTKFEQVVNGKMQEVTGRPTTGENVTVVITAPISKIGGLNVVVLTDNVGIGLDNAFLTAGAGRTASTFKGTFFLPKKDSSQALYYIVGENLEINKGTPFQLTIIGTDTDGQQLQRLDTRKTITPVAITLKIAKLSGALYVDEDLTIPYTVENMGDRSALISVDFTDDKGFAGPSPEHNYTLPAGGNTTGTYKLHAGKTAGEVTTVTMTAQAIDITGSSPHHEFLKLTVERRPDNSTPECNVTSVTGSCTVTQMDPCNCHKYKWSGKAVFGDVGWGLSEISSTVPKIDTFNYDKFTKGDTIDKGLKKADIKSDCCNPQAIIKLTDMANNTGQCKFDVAPGLTKPSIPCTTTTAASTSTTLTSTVTSVAPVTLATSAKSAFSVTFTKSATPVKSVTIAKSATPPNPATFGSSSNDTVAPVCNVTSTHGRCSKDQMKAEQCDDHVWFGTVQFGDEGSGLYMVKTTEEGESGTLKADDFNPGDTLDKGFKTATLTTTCCNALAYVIVVDVAGNKGQCELDVREPEMELSTGAIAGIAVGSLAALAGIVLAAVLITKFGRCGSGSTSPHPDTNTGRRAAWD